jgi:hypothetical protein
MKFGILGNPHTRGWLFTGPLAVVLHLIGNTANAWMIQRTNGFHRVNVGDLTLLWLTRPRLAWMIVVLVPWQSKEVMYFSVAASCLFTEIVLQLVSVYYIGRAVNYARMQKFFDIGRLRDSTAPRSADAMIMYGGALLWLVVIFFALLAYGFVVFGIDHLIGRQIRGKSRKAKKNGLQCAAAQTPHTAQGERECGDCFGRQRHMGHSRAGEFIGPLR